MNNLYEKINILEKVNYEGIGIDWGAERLNWSFLKTAIFVNSMIYDTATFYRDFCSNVNQKINVDFENLI